ncbi:MAG: WYL domain-containing protein [Candidatus Woesearchaeota archaeon]
MKKISQDYNNVDFKRENIDDDIENISFDSFSDYLVDNHEDEIDEEKKIEPGHYDEYPPLEMTEEDVPDFNNNTEIIKWAIDNNRVVRINYTTKKGIDITRIIEPHALKISRGTHNDLLIAYDRSVREARAFIVNNILNCIIIGDIFTKRINILPKRGVISMRKKEKIKKSFSNISKELKENKLYKAAELVDDIKNSILNIKTAQYVGSQGYWIRNGRCWKNCYRKKRAKNPDKSAQEVWMDCFEEYNNSIVDDNEDWAKYAKEEGGTEKIASKKEDKILEKYFHRLISNKINKGFPIGNAVFSTINEHNNIKTSFLDNINNLLVLSDSLKNNGYEKIGNNIEKFSNKIIKEADFGGGGWDRFKGFLQKDNAKVSYRIKNLIQRANYLLNKIQNKITVNAKSKKFNLKKAQLNLEQRFPNNPVDNPNMPEGQNIDQEQQRKQQKQMFLKEITQEYNEFVKDVREEISFLYNLASKNQDMQQYIQPAMRIMNQFIMQNNQAMQQRQLTPRFMINSLSSLIQELVGAGNDMQQAEMQVNQQGQRSRSDEGEQPQQGVQQGVQQQERPNSQTPGQQPVSNLINQLHNNVGKMDDNDFAQLKSLYFSALSRRKKSK